MLPLERVQQRLAAERAVIRVADRERDRAALAQLAPLVAQALADVVLAGVALEAEQPAELAVLLKRGGERLDVGLVQRAQDRLLADQALGPADRAADRRQPDRSPTRVSSRPRAADSITISSPGWSQTRGLRTLPTPAGVPVDTRSPGSSVISFDR